MIATFTVNSLSDGDTRDGTSDTITGSGPNATGTLRQAINFANAHPGATITFDLPAHSVITIGAELPLILRNNTIIDGTLAGNTTVTIDGASTTATSGYRVFFVGDAGQISDTGTNLGQGRTAVTIKNLTIQNASATVAWMTGVCR